MNRSNTIIEHHATVAAMCLYQAGLLGRDGFFEEAAGMTHRMLKARSELKMWLKISQAIRGWKL